MLGESRGSSTFNQIGFQNIKQLMVEAFRPWAELRAIRRGRQREDYRRWERSPSLRHGTPLGVLFPVLPVGRAHPAGTVAFGAITEHPLDPTLTFADLAPHRVPVTTVTLRPVVPTYLQLLLIVIGFWL